MAGERFNLRWNEFEPTISGAMKDLRASEDFFDVTLACKGKQVQAHKVVLAACSPFFREILKTNIHPHPLLYLQSVPHADLLAVLDFMYHGEVQIVQEDLVSFLAVAEELEVKGLMRNDHPDKRSRIQDNGGSLPKLKKPRISEEPSPSTSEDPAMLEMTESSVKMEPEYDHGIENFVHPREGFGDHGEEFVDPLAWQIAENGHENQENSFVRKRAPSTPSTKGNQANRDKIAACVIKLSSQEFVCRLCEHKTSIKQSLEKHIENQHYPGSYECNVCLNTFNSQNSLSVHVRRKHRPPAQDQS